MNLNQHKSFQIDHILYFRISQSIHSRHATADKYVVSSRLNETNSPKKRERDETDDDGKGKRVSEWEKERRDWKPQMSRYYSGFGRKGKPFDVKLC